MLKQLTVFNSKMMKNSQTTRIYYLKDQRLIVLLTQLKQYIKLCSCRQM
jgi:hypothetical protein